MASAFKARFSSLCIPCDEWIQPGEFITNHPEHGFIHEECTDTADTIAAPESNGAAFDSFNRGRPPRAVLPRGKTAKDRCDKCFIIHTPGQDGCE